MYRSLPHPLRSTLRFANPSLSPWAALTPLIVNGLSTTITGRARIVFRRRAAGLFKPFCRHALGAVLAALLCRSVNFHPAARRPRKLAIGSTSLLGQLFRSGRAANIAPPPCSSFASPHLSVQCRRADCAPGGRRPSSLGCAPWEPWCYLPTVTPPAIRKRTCWLR